MPWSHAFSGNPFCPSLFLSSYLICPPLVLYMDVAVPCFRPQCCSCLPPKPLEYSGDLFHYFPWVWIWIHMKAPHMAPYFVLFCTPFWISASLTLSCQAFPCSLIFRFWSPLKLRDTTSFNIHCLYQRKMRWSNLPIPWAHFKLFSSVKLLLILFKKKSHFCCCEIGKIYHFNHTVQ